MEEGSRIKALEGDDCKQITYKVCQLANTNIKMDNIEIADRSKNHSLRLEWR